MRIAHIAVYYYPITGGMENHVYFLTKELAKNNEVHVFTTNTHNGETIGKEEEVIDKVHVHRIPVKHQFSYYLTFYPLIEELKKYDFDIAHFHSFGFPQHDKAVLYLKKRGVKIIVTPHGPPVIYHPNRPKYQYWLKDLYNKTLGKRAYKAMDMVFAINPSQFGWISKLGVKKSRIKLVPNGISVDCLKKPKGIERFNQKCNLKNKKILLYVGRIHEHKGIQDVISILPDVIKKHPDVCLVLIGPDDSYRKKLEELAEQKNINQYVKFLGFVSEEEKRAAFATADLFVIPSKFEGCPTVVMEAFAQGLPTLGSRVGGIPFLLNNGEFGYIVEFGNQEAIKTKILEHFKKNKKEIIKLRKKCLQRAHDFTWDKLSRKILDVYKEVLK